MEWCAKIKPRCAAGSSADEIDMPVGVSSTKTLGCGPGEDQFTSFLRAICLVVR